jgi:nitroreductase
MVLSGVIMQPRSSMDVWNIDEGGFPANSSSKERLTFLINYAILAPSSHNTQPWIFNVSDDEILVYADQSKWLSVADADKREMYLSLGAALENLIISAEHFGYNCTLSYFPGEEDLVAAVSFQAATRQPSKSPLFHAITARKTNRNAYELRAISGEDLEALSRYCFDPDVAVYLSDSSEAKNEFLDLVVEANGVLYSDINYKSELGRYLGLGVMGPTGFEAKLAQMAVVFLDVRAEQAKKDADLINSTPYIGFICTDKNDSISTLNAGRVLERFWLAATSLGISLQPMSQPLEVPQIKSKLAVLLPAGSEKRVVQQTFRLGYARAEAERSNRRPLDDVLRER